MIIHFIVRLIVVLFAVIGASVVFGIVVAALLAHAGRFDEWNQ